MIDREVLQTLTGRERGEYVRAMRQGLPWPPAPEPVVEPPLPCPVIVADAEEV